MQLRVQPPDAGKRANLNNIQRELREMDIPFRMEHLFDIYRRASNQFETLVVRETTEYEIMVNVSEDGQLAEMTVIPPQMGQDKLTPAKIKQAMEKAHVEKGVLYDEVKRVLTQQVLNEPVVIAKGKASYDGEDGKIEYHTESTTSAGAVEENRVDFKEMNLIKNVQEGEVVATITPPTLGADGFMVTGKTLKGKNGRRARFKLGRNVAINENRTQVVATSPGFVVQSGERISVEDVLEIDNVDGSTGNVRFTGVIRVKGHVDDNFVVEGEKGIEVWDTVGKATLKSRGDIKINGGAIGATIESHKNVHAKFLNECKITSGNNVIVGEYILHSTVDAGKSVQIISPADGFINGGKIRAGDSVWTAHLGSKMSEERTIVEVGAGAQLKKELDQILDRINNSKGVFDKYSKNLRVLQHNLETKGVLEEDHAERFEQMSTKALTLRDNLMNDLHNYNRLAYQISAQSESEGFVFVSQQAHAGAGIQIKRFKQNLNSILEACAFRIISGELKAQSYGAALKSYKMQYGRKPR